MKVVRDRALKAFARERRQDVMVPKLSSVIPKTATINILAPKFSREPRAGRKNKTWLIGKRGRKGMLLT